MFSVIVICVFCGCLFVSYGSGFLIGLVYFLLIILYIGYLIFDELMNIVLVIFVVLLLNLYFKLGEFRNGFLSMWSSIGARSVFSFVRRILALFELIFVLIMMVGLW